jgi:nitrogen regulatory protein PII
VKMVMIVVDDAKKEELEVVLERAGVVGYTEISRASGRGTTGPRLGSGAFPRTSAVVFSVLSGEALARLTQTLHEFCDDCGERLKIVAWDVEEIA